MKKGGLVTFDGTLKLVPSLMRMSKCLNKN